MSAAQPAPVATRACAGSEPGFDVREIALTKDQVETAIMMYLKEVRGHSFASVRQIRFPVYDAGGAAGAVAEVAVAR